MLTSEWQRVRNMIDNAITASAAKAPAVEIKPMATDEQLEAIEKAVSIKEIKQVLYEIFS